MSRNDSTKKLTKIITVMIISICLILGLSSCMLIPSGDNYYDSSSDANDNITPRFASRPQGSADILEGNVLIISIYAKDSKHMWNDDDMAYTKKAMNTAVSWLESQSRKYAHSADIIYENGDLRYELKKEGLTDAALSDESSDRFLDFYDDVEEYIQTNIPVNALKKKYKARSAGFVLFLPAEGNSFTLPYVRSYSTTMKYYNEFTTLFLYDASLPNQYENPATYAHEMLHLFGAVDLYQKSKKDGITNSLVSEIKSDYPHELMYYTYDSNNASNFESINKSLSPYTLYFIGWSDGKKEIKKHPEIERDVRCAF
jgi:hypothetical protein